MLLDFDIHFDADEIELVALDLGIEKPSIEEVTDWIVKLVNEKLQIIKIEKEVS